MNRLLVVDDSPLDMQIAGDLIAEQGFSPLFASNGREALTVLERENPDAVLTDLQIKLAERVGQGVTGFHIRLNSQDQILHTRILVASANNLE